MVRADGPSRMGRMGDNDNNGASHLMMVSDLLRRGTGRAR